MNNEPSNKKFHSIFYYNTNKPLPSYEGANADAASAIGPRIVSDIFKDLFPNPIAYISSSECLTPSQRISSGGGDRRLQSWNEMREKRAKIQKRIQRKTGKRSDEILFNRKQTVDECDKMMMQRLIDCSQRIESTSTTKPPQQPTMLTQSCCDTQHAICNEIQPQNVALPQAMQRGVIPLEVFGMPEGVRRELLGPKYDANVTTKWLQSQILRKRVGEKIHDIERIVEFYPDLKNLQVLNGEPVIPNKPVKNIELLHSYDLSTISGDTEELGEFKFETPTESESAPIAEIPHTHAIKVNGEIYIANEKTSSKNADIELFFQCDPYQIVTKVLIHLVNIGEKIVSFEWKREWYYGYSHNLHRSLDDEFIFDKRPFNLLPGQCRKINVMYRPRNVDIFRDVWTLRTNVNFFCRRNDNIKVDLQGICTVPHALNNLIDNRIQTVVYKSNKAAMSELTHLHGGLVPLIQPPENVCPYAHTFMERELFNAQNIGYICTRYEDIELLKALFKRLKKPREHEWNLYIGSIKELILRQENALERETEMSNLNVILMSMKGAMDVETKDNVRERDRSRYIYVKGIIASCIDEWEELAFTLQKQYFKSELPLYLAELLALEEEEGNEEKDFDKDIKRNISYVHDLTKIPSFIDEEIAKAAVLKRINHSKYFRDSLYIETYSILCDVAENIVSVIESTD